MKNYFLIIFFLMLCYLESQIPVNICFLQNIDRVNRYNANLLSKNDKLYVSAEGATEQYEILDDGSLNLTSYVSYINNFPVNSKIEGDDYYVGVKSDINTHQFIYKIDISNDVMQVNQIYDTNNFQGIYNFDTNGDYLVYVLEGQTEATVLDRFTLEEVGNLSTGGFFSLRDSYLFYQMNNGSSNYLYIDDISEINNQMNIGSVYLGEDQQNITYIFENNHLFIGQNNQIVILDISDYANPIVLSAINDFAGISYPNFFTSVIKYENQLIIKNEENKIWIYDITDLNNPIFQGFCQDFSFSQNYLDTSVLNDNFLYLAQSSKNIFQIDLTSSPNLTLVDEFGKVGQFIYYEYNYPFLIYSNLYTRDVRITNISSPEPFSYELIDNTNTHNKTFYLTDQSIGFLVEDNNQKYLNLYSMDQGIINLEAVNSLPSSNFEKVIKFGDYIALIAEDDCEIQICEINPDYSLDYVHLISTGENCRIVEQTDLCSQDHAFVTSLMNDEYVTTIYSTQSPFNEVANFSLEQFGSYITSLFRLSDNRILLSGWDYSQNYYKLAVYNSPDDIQVIDSYNSSNVVLKLHENILILNRNLSGEVIYVSWQNDQLDNVGSYEFDIDTIDCFFDFDNNKLFTIGRFYIQEYSCNYVLNDNYTIPSSKLSLSNYPNPFNPSTTISYNFNTDHIEQADISIYNLKGQKVKTFSNLQITQSQYQQIVWDGTDQNNQPVSSGVYFYQLKNNGKAVAQKKCLLIK